MLFVTVNSFERVIVCVRRGFVRVFVEVELVDADSVNVSCAMVSVMTEVREDVFTPSTVVKPKDNAQHKKMQ